MSVTFRNILARKQWNAARRPWAIRAAELAAWAMQRAVNRTDVWGGYLPEKFRTEGRQPGTTKPAKKKRGDVVLTEAVLAKHFACEGEGDVVGLHSTSVENTSLWGALDFDKHDDSDGQPSVEQIFDFASSILNDLTGMGFHPLLTDSNGKGGLHLRICFSEPVDSGPLYRWLQSLVARHGDFGFSTAPECFPKQESLDHKKRYGNWLRLPGRHHTHKHLARVLSGSAWLAADEAIAAILATTGDDPALMPFIPPPQAAAKQTEGHHRHNGQLTDVLARASKYLDSVPGAVSGQRGHNTTYRVACKLIQGFDLTPRQAIAPFVAWNQRCQPPWGVEDLEKKLRDAESEPGRRGYLLHDDRARKKKRSPIVAAATRGAEVSDTIPSIIADDGRTDLANARRFVAIHGESIRYCAAWGKWLIWDGDRWRVDETLAIESLAKDVSRQLWESIIEWTPELDSKELVPLIRFATASSNDRGLTAMVKQARSEKAVAVLPDQLDIDRWLLNCPNGTLDLRTGDLRPHSRDDRITKLCPTPYDPAAKCPLWEESFLPRIMDNDGELIAFLQRAAGYSLAGSVREECLFFCWGKGRNGKSKFLDALSRVLGPDYAMTAPHDFLMAHDGERHPTDLADLWGKRFVTTIETDDGKALAESLVKTLTGGDPIRARRMRENFWEFAPSHKLWLAANYKPKIRGSDDGIWERIKLIPFTVYIPPEERDKSLAEKLAAEAPGILAWMVRGCLDWQANGLGTPQTMADAAKEYRDEEDTIGQFLAECCLKGDGKTVRAKALRTAYAAFCADRGDREASSKRFGDYLAAQGIGKHTSNGVVYDGIGLIDERRKPPDGKAQAAGEKADCGVRDDGTADGF